MKAKVNSVNTADCYDFFLPFQSLFIFSFSNSITAGSFRLSYLLPMVYMIEQPLNALSKYFSLII